MDQCDLRLNVIATPMGYLLALFLSQTQRVVLAVISAVLILSGVVLVLVGRAIARRALPGFEVKQSTGTESPVPSEKEHDHG